MNARIGVIADLKPGGAGLPRVTSFGLTTCELNCWNTDLYSPALADQVRREAQQSSIKIGSLWAGWPGPAVWDFIDGPATLGLVPAAYRAARIVALKRAGEFAQQVGLPAIVTHLGFIPENPGDPLFAEVVAAVREVAVFLKEKGLEFWLETGQETPVTMLRLIQQVGTGNLWVNLDPANLILYGKANPIDALDVFGDQVRSVHAKDGLYPTDPMKLGEEVVVGAGRVRFPEFIRALEQGGYTGDYIIEREISGPQQQADIHATIAYLDGLLGAPG
jgi:L-ribulose-5-phosphate 3-epimerase